MALWRYFGLLWVLVSLPTFAEENFAAVFLQSEQLVRQGHYLNALQQLKSAQPLANTDDQRTQILGLVGLTRYRMHHYQQAETLLQQAVNTKLGEPLNRARWFCALAALKADQNQPEQARQLYSEALKLAADNSELMVSIQLGRAQLLSGPAHLAELQRIYPLITTITTPEARIPQLINLAVQAHKSKASRPTDKLAPESNTQKQSRAGRLKLAYESLQQAKNLATEEQPRLWAEVLAELAQLYEDEQRTDEALYLNSQAIKAEKQVQADDLLLDLQWRQGRLFKSKNQLPEAMAAYEQAVAHIEAIRQDIPVEYHDGRSSFRETLEPVYLGLAELLLTEANKQTGAHKMQLLRRARDTVELIKQSELADFLGGRCAISTASSAHLEDIASGTAVLYPIILPERLELLVSYGNDVQHYSQSISAVNLQGLVLSFAHSLRYGTDNADTFSKQLYELLIKPIKASLQEHHVQTLVWVPDGILRLISPAALSDGEHYLIEQYAVATSPGLTLFASSHKQQDDMQVLLAGMSVPGPVLEHLPLTWANQLSEASQRGGSLNKSGSRALPPMRREITQASTSDTTRNQDLKKSLSLPGVEHEMHSLQQGVANTLLLNETFTVNNFKQQLLQKPYSVVHIASHGVFGNNADNSFVMAYDDLITMNQLEQLLKADKFKQQPVELLTLSACQTAEGDDRAPLGLSGIAIKSKVRTALGTLWPVDDQAASQLMTEFYKNLTKPGVNKAVALQQAQLNLLKYKELKHPYFWSPFILVGNWL
jgi:CHAT domain-containing protein/tetratricopeptide (TPR) repeat protein